MIVMLKLFFYLVERHRKEKINAGINRIGNLLPCSQALKQVRDKLTLLFSFVSNTPGQWTHRAVYRWVAYFTIKPLSPAE